MDISGGDVYWFIVEYKWWLAALVPFALAILALKMRG